jgi:hypothetical protein
MGKSSLIFQATTMGLDIYYSLINIKSKIKRILILHLIFKIIYFFIIKIVVIHLYKNW